MQDLAITHVQIRTALYIIRKHRWKVLTVFLLTVIIVAIGTLLVTPIYRGSSKLLVKPGREDVYVSPTGDSTQVIDRSFQGEKVNAEIAILSNLALVSEFVDLFGVQTLFDYPDRTLKGRFLNENKKRKIPPIREVYKSVLRNLDVSNVPRSNVIDVAFTWPDPVIAATVVNELVDLYLMKHLEVHTNPQTYSLLEEQAKKWEKRLRESEDRVETFKQRHSITSLAEQRTILLTRLSEAESQKKRTDSEIQETREMIVTLENQLSKLDQNVRLEERTNTKSTTLADLKARLVDLELQGLKEEISRVKEMIAEEEKKGSVEVISGESPIRRSLEGDLLRAKTRLEALKARENSQKLEIESYKEETKLLDGFERQMNNLARQVEINEGNYKLYLTKFEEARISENMDKQRISNVKIIEPAVPDMKPVKPRKMINAFMGVFLGLVGGIGLAFLIEFIHPVFRTREDVDQFLGVPVLAILPKE